MEDGTKLASNIKRVNSFVRQLKKENEELREKLEQGFEATAEDTLTYHKLRSEAQNWERKAEDLESKVQELKLTLQDKESEITGLTKRMTELETEIKMLKAEQRETSFQPRVHNERGAGRKRKQPEVTTDMIRALVQEKGADQAAAELHISKRTLYRRLAENKADKSASTSLPSQF